MEPEFQWTVPLGHPWDESLPPGPTLYVVATPIGNLEDITIRALRVLNGVDVILSEDTRKSQRLLQRYKIQTTQKSFRVHQIRADVAHALEQLKQGKTLALISDAGTPGISDPGSHLVRQVREDLPDCPIIPIPGPSALSAALSICGWQTNPTTFLGFLPRKPGKMRSALESGSADAVLVIYESVHRIKKTLEFLRAELPQRPILLGREITKLHEQWIQWLPEREMPQFTEKGEFVILMGPARSIKKEAEVADSQDGW